jgi:hypothetical protein
MKVNNIKKNGFEKKAKSKRREQPQEEIIESAQ